MKCIETNIGQFNSSYVSVSEWKDSTLIFLSQILRDLDSITSDVAEAYRASIQIQQKKYHPLIHLHSFLFHVGVPFSSQLGHSPRQCGSRSTWNAGSCHSFSSSRFGLVSHASRTVQHRCHIKICSSIVHTGVWLGQVMQWNLLREVGE